MTQVRRLSRIDLISADPARLAAFYEGLGFTCSHSANSGARGETRLELRLGAERIDLVRPSNLGAPYPPSVPGWSPRFQHLAIVVSDIRAAYARIQPLAGWTAISTDGPQSLPETSGGATAFKFRDPEGHPLELIAFATAHTPDQWRLTSSSQLFLGIDHSAISVADTQRSVDFYKQLGLAPTGRSLNVGVAQAKLDAVEDPHVEVTALSATNHPTPHVELLCYRGNFIRDRRPLSPEDIAASRLVFEVPPLATVRTAPSPRRDPDGHMIVLDECEPYSGST